MDALVAGIRAFAGSVLNPIKEFFGGGEGEDGEDRPGLLGRIFGGWRRMPKWLNRSRSGRCHRRPGAQGKRAPARRSSAPGRAPPVNVSASRRRHRVTIGATIS